MTWVLASGLPRASQGLGVTTRRAVSRQSGRPTALFASRPAPQAQTSAASKVGESAGPWTGPQPRSPAFPAGEGPAHRPWTTLQVAHTSPNPGYEISFMKEVVSPAS